MINNDVIRSLRYILNVNDQKMVEIYSLSGRSISLDLIQKILINEEDPTYILCDDKTMAHFLDGLIYFKRGKDESKPPVPMELPMTNNIILKKLRVAFELKEDDILQMFKTVEFTIGRSEFSALMRKKGHPNYRECGDQVMRYFLKGLKIKIRG